jgi:hypothetical protein
MSAWKVRMCAARTCEEDGFRFPGAWQGRSADDRRAARGVRGALAADNLGLRYGVTVRTLNSGKWTKSIETDDATSMRARARASWGLTGRAQGPAPLWSQDSGRRLLPGQSGARQGALPLPWWQIDRSEDASWSRAHRRGAAPPLARLSREGSGGQKWRRNRI